MQTGDVANSFHDAFHKAASHDPIVKTKSPKLSPAPFASEEAVYNAISQAGRETVAHRLVDSYFGNVSYHWNHTLYISQTGSSLDELGGHVDPVPMDGSTTAGLTASSELTAHMDVVRRTGCRAILHGHPKFAVILSMDCTPREKARCAFSDQCHIKCPESRFAAGVPIVPGEVGTGPTGLCHTLPPALEDHPGAIVYGHGLFTTGRDDFNEAFQSMLEIEEMCRRQYFQKVSALAPKSL
jgi:ribulose-5-phosphate 4-epimerase/fuculose-1-phosphate aldolase